MKTLQLQTVLRPDPARFLMYHGSLGEWWTVGNGGATAFWADHLAIGAPESAAPEFEDWNVYVQFEAPDQNEANTLITIHSAAGKRLQSYLWSDEYHDLTIEGYACGVEESARALWEVGQAGPQPAYPSIGAMRDADRTARDAAAYWGERSALKVAEARKLGHLGGATEAEADAYAYAYQAGHVSGRTGPAPDGGDHGRHE